VFVVCCHERGYGVAADINTAKYWCSMAKNLGSMDTMVVRAQRLVRMNNHVDQQKSMDYCRDASKQKDADAVLELGFIYRYGLSILIKPLDSVSLQELASAMQHPRMSWV
jgi:TPR repeat protein